jgi:hypothetical protein
MKSKDTQLLEEAYKRTLLLETEKWVQEYLERGSKGDLDLDRSYITELPDNLVVNGSLDLNCCSKLKALPKGLVVKHDLNLYGCGFIEEFPPDAKVGGTIDLRGTRIKVLPPNLNVGGSLYISRYTRLSENTTIALTLHIDTPFLKKAEPLPKGLKVHNLYSPQLDLQELPDDIEVIDRTMSQKFSEEEAKKYLATRNKVSKIEKNLPQLKGLF